MTTPRIPPAQISGPFGQFVKMLTRRMFGSTPDSVAIMWHHRRVFRDSMGFGRKVDSWDVLDKNLATYAGMAAAATIGCSFCLDLNYFLAHQKGLDEDKARQVPQWRTSEVFTPTERRVMEYAEAMCTTPVSVTDELSEALLETLGPAGLVELTARVGFMNSTARGNVAMGIRSAEFAEACGLAPLAAPAASISSVSSRS